MDTSKELRLISITGVPPQTIPMEATGKLINALVAVNPSAAVEVLEGTPGRALPLLEVGALERLTNHSSGAIRLRAMIALDRIVRESREMEQGTVDLTAPRRLASGL